MPLRGYGLWTERSLPIPMTLLEFGQWEALAGEWKTEEEYKEGIYSFGLLSAG